MRLPVWNASWSTAERSVGWLIATVTTSLRPEPLNSYGRTCSFSAICLLTHLTARGSIFTSASFTLGIPRCLVKAATTASSLQKPFCTRMPPSLPPHCFWCPSALWSWCSSMTPSSVSSSPRRLRGGIVFPSLPLDSREVFVSREDALLDQQLDHRLERGHRPALRLFHAAQHVYRALSRRRRGSSLSFRHRRLPRARVDDRVARVVHDLHAGLLADLVAEQLFAAVPAGDGIADGARTRQLRLDLLSPGEGDQMIGSADVERVAHRHHQDPALVLEADRYQPELLGRIGRHHPERSLVGFAAEISAHDAGLLRQRANQDLLG